MYIFQSWEVPSDLVKIIWAFPPLALSKISCESPVPTLDGILPICTVLFANTFPNEPVELTEPLIFALAKVEIILPSTVKLSPSKVKSASSFINPAVWANKTLPAVKPAEVIAPLELISPATVKVFDGAAVPMPTFPPLK